MLPHPKILSTWPSRVNNTQLSGISIPSINQTDKLSSLRTLETYLRRWLNSTLILECQWLKSKTILGILSNALLTNKTSKKYSRIDSSSSTRSSSSSPQLWRVHKKDRTHTPLQFNLLRMRETKDKTCGKTLLSLPSKAWTKLTLKIIKQLCLITNRFSSSKRSSLRVRTQQ